MTDKDTTSKPSAISPKPSTDKGRPHIEKGTFDRGQKGVSLFNMQQALNGGDKQGGDQKK